MTPAAASAASTSASARANSSSESAGTVPCGALAAIDHLHVLAPTYAEERLKWRR